jgi:hypothetical protein
LKVMSAIERCRTAALGGHVARCENTACGHTEISYNCKIWYSTMQTVSDCARIPIARL